jgi:hypothetical protein
MGTGSEVDGNEQGESGTTVKLEIGIQLVAIADALVSGFEGGIGYWSEIVKYEAPPEYKWYFHDIGGMPGERRVYPHIDDVINPGGAVLLSDIESGGVSRLNWEAVLHGLRRVAEVFPEVFGNIIADNSDAEDGDILIQCALFGTRTYA